MNYLFTYSVTTTQGRSLNGTIDVTDQTTPAEAADIAMDVIETMYTKYLRGFTILNVSVTITERPVSGAADASQL